MIIDFPILSVKECAAALGVTQETLRYHMAMRRLPYHVVGKTYCISKADLLDFKEARIANGWNKRGPSKKV